MCAYTYTLKKRYRLYYFITVSKTIQARNNDRIIKDATASISL